MHLRKRNLFQLLISAIMIFIFAIFASQPAKADSANLSDGTYTVPVTLLKAGSNSTSIANMFFTQSANVTVANGSYQIQLQTSGAQYITSMTVGGQAVTQDPSGHITVTLTNPSELEPVSFGLKVPIIGTMNQNAQFDFKWGSAQKDPTAAATPAASSSSATTPAATSSSAPAAAASSSASSSSAVTREPNMAPSKTTATKKTTAKTTSKSTWTYTVLKASGNSKSIANKYYTHVASVKKVNKHYNVVLKVSYKKSLKLGSKAVRPVSINNHKPSAVKYGATKSTYNMTYAFNVASTNTLKKIIKGKIHVKVPYLNISQTFGIRFKFSHHTTATKTTTHKLTALKAEPANGSSAASAATATNARLPQTGDRSQQAVSVVGAVFGSSLLLGWGLVHESL
ncbi:iron transport-associated domain protein [Lentilactobacillus parafarraginis F0439]|uniref:Iron transport-associated domain protein n=1 Tax=Lentilactobacillus parafarraginis F0439 TaxID=797515 RepID=G9ZQ91_9LACO|nr:NEAT domain-containing protein [Lentilactobacillus parafarraginis]EHL97647.1 iron transport-associated domain protein [Lentilactobacillus parafarraginis F0439]